MDYEQMTVIQLKKLCKDLQIHVANKKKAEIIAILIAHDKKRNQNKIAEINDEKMDIAHTTLENKCQESAKQNQNNVNIEQTKKQIHELYTKDSKSEIEKDVKMGTNKDNEYKLSVSEKTYTNDASKDTMSDTNKNNHNVNNAADMTNCKFYIVHEKEELEEGEIYNTKKVKIDQTRKHYKVFYNANNDRLQTLAKMSEAERIEARKKGLTLIINKKNYT